MFFSFFFYEPFPYSTTVLNSSMTCLIDRDGIRSSPFGKFSDWSLVNALYITVSGNRPHFEKHLRQYRWAEKKNETQNFPLVGRLSISKQSLRKVSQSLHLKEHLAFFQSPLVLPLLSWKREAELQPHAGNKAKETNASHTRAKVTFTFFKRILLLLLGLESLNMTQSYYMLDKHLHISASSFYATK